MAVHHRPAEEKEREKPTFQHVGGRPGALGQGETARWMGNTRPSRKQAQMDMMGWIPEGRDA